MIVQRPIGHMPFPGHRTQKEVREDEDRTRMKRRMAAKRGGDSWPAVRAIPVARQDQIADWMTRNGGTIAECAASLGISYKSVQHAWTRIKDRLGEQAQ